MGVQLKVHRGGYAEVVPQVLHHPQSFKHRSQEP